MLLPIEVDLISKKKGRKENWIKFGSSSNGKIVFGLLTEIIKFYVRPIAIDVK